MASPSYTCRYRKADAGDVPGMASIRAREWGTDEYWVERIGGYLRREIHPEHSLPTRVAFIAEADGMTVGFVAGHITRRYDCSGEMEWINVLPEYREHGIALGLLRLLAGWFTQNGAPRVCVDVSPANAAARRFYARHGAVPLKRHWLVWEDITALAGRSHAAVPVRS